MNHRTFSPFTFHFSLRRLVQSSALANATNRRHFFTFPFSFLLSLAAALFAALSTANAAPMDARLRCPRMDLPRGVHRVEYINGGTDGYINTGIVPLNHETDFEYTVDSFVSDKHLIGTTYSDYYYHFTEYDNKYFWGRNGSEGSGGTWTAGKHKVLFNNGADWRVILDGVTIGSGTRITAPNGYPLYIGRRNNSVYGFHKMHWLKIIDKDTNTLVRDFIPVRFTNSDGVQEGAMYDRVSRQLFRNAGTGSFIIGPDL